MIPATDDELSQAARAVVQGDPAAEPFLRELCGRFPGDARVHFLLGALLERLARLDASLEALDRALELDADHVQALSAKSTVLLRLNRPQEAYRLLNDAVERQPDVSQLRYNLGVSLETLADFAGALAAYDGVLALADPPRDAYMNRGYVLTRLGRLAEALENNRKLVELAPGNPDSHFNMAEVLLASQRPAEALAACEIALRIEPVHAKAAIGSGLALSQLGRLAEAQAAFDRVRERNPEAIRSFVNAYDTAPSEDPDRFDPELLYLFSACRRLHDCDWSGRDALIERFRKVILERAESGRGLSDPGLAYNVLTLPLPDSLRLATASGLSRRIASLAASSSAVFRRRAAPSERLRIGYLSPDFREHLNAYLLHPLLRLHDRSRFEVFCYSTGPGDASPIRRTVECAADRFVDVALLDDNRIAEEIRGHGIDILIDAGGFTTYSRPGVMARRPAPVQVGYLAFPGTQAMDAVPYRIVDKIASPPQQREAWTEALIYLPDTFFIYDRFEPLAPVSLSRSEYGLPDDAFVFCSFNNYYKIEPEIFGVWMDILKAVPGSVLWLAGRSAVASKNLCDEAESRGVPQGRLIFAPFESRERYRARFRLADLFLDTPIFNAMTTACDALAAGLPLLTFTGASFPSRVATSLLAAAGFREGIADSLAAYRDRAIEWGRQPGILGELRRRRLAYPLSTALFDTAARVQQIERAYEEMWRRHQLGLPPESFNVAARPAPAFRSRWH